MRYHIFPPEEIIETTVTLPPSKSMVARALVMGFIVRGCKPYQAALPADADSDDIRVLADILGRGLPNDGATLNVEASGTALRLLTALCAACEGSRCRITGTDRLRERPVGPLVETLRAMGADISYGVREGFAPLDIVGHRLDGGEVMLDPATSSQYATALMLVSPLLRQPLKIKYVVPTVSAPYAALTAAMMRMRGLAVEADSDGVVVSAGSYAGDGIDIEPDWSAATFWYEIAAVSAGWVTLPGLRASSPQPDRRAVQLFEQIGAVTEFTDDGVEISATPELINFLDVDCRDNPDLVPPLVVACCLVGIPFRLGGVAALRHKESDRLAALRDEMVKVGCELTIEHYDDVLSWDGKRHPVRVLPGFDSHGDHRIAMSLAAAALFMPGVSIDGTECVAKSYPHFWDDLRAAGFDILTREEALVRLQQGGGEGDGGGDGGQQ